MGRKIEQAAPGYTLHRVPQGWILLRLETDSAGILADVTVAVIDGPEMRPYVWANKRLGRKQAIAASWQLQRDEDIAAERARSEQLAAENRHLKAQLQHALATSEPLSLAIPS